MIRLRHDAHGDRCSCRILAAAVGCKSDALRFAYCQAVLQRRWTMDCNHGCRPAPASVESRGKWHDLGPIDPVKAILIENE